MIHSGGGGGGEVSGDQPSEMQLAGRLVLSVAGFLLLTLAYKYVKSRGSWSRAKRGGDGDGAEQEDHPGHEGAGREEGLGLGLRQRRLERKEGSYSEKGPSAPAVHPPGPAGTRKPEMQGPPVSREPDQTEGKGKAEEGQQEESETGHLGAGCQPSEKCLEEAVRGSAGAVLSKDTSARPVSGAGATLGKQKAPSPSLLGCQEDALGNPSQEGHGRNEGAVEAELCLTFHEDPLSRREQEAFLETGKGQPRGEGASLPVAQRPGGQGRIQLHQATSDMSLAIEQNHLHSQEEYVFSSVALVQVEENVLREKTPEELSPGHVEVPGASLRGKVYDYYVKTESRTILKEKALPAHLSSQRSPPQSSLPKSRGFEEHPVHSFEVENQANRVPPKEAPDLSPESDPLPTGEGDTTSKQEPLSQVEDSSQAIGCKKSPGPRGGFCRQDSFQRILEDPDLQVPMERLSPPPTSASAESLGPPCSSLCSGSLSSLVGSMQGLQKDTGQEATVELVAGAKFFHIPLSPESSVEVHLDLGNCYEVLCAAKKQNLESLRKAAYQVMSDNYLQVLRTRAIFGCLNAMERDLILRRRMQGKKFVTVVDVSSQDHHSPQASRLCFYNDQKDSWHPLTHMPLEAVSRGCAVCSMFNYLFVVAGCEGRGKFQKPSNRVFCYNPLTNIWQEIAPLSQARPHCKLVALEGFLYAIGGECLYTVERYDPRTDRWTFVAPLPNDTFAVAHTATACDGEIYVTGGTLRYMLLRYVSRTNTWKISLTGASKDRTTEMVTASGFIYRFDLNRSLGISVYRCGAKAKLWYECATYPMPFPACFQCAVVDNLVHCISRQFHLRFLADYVSPRFGAKELQGFPSPRGALLPVTLVLPDRTRVQTRV